MNKYIKFAILALFLNFQPTQIISRTLDLILAVDQLEKFDNQPTTFTAMTDDLEAMFCQKPGIIIASGQLTYNVLKRKPELKDELSNWEIYKTAQDDTFFVYIPKSYKKKIEEEFKKTEQKIDEHLKKAYSINEIIFGLKLDHPELLQRIELDEKRIDEIQTNYKADWHDELKNLFVTGQEDIFPYWNLIIDGHGSDFADEIINLKSKKEIMTTSYGESLSVAGFKLPNFRDFLQFLTSKIKVNFLYYSTCFGGDVNFELPFVNLLINRKILSQDQDSKTVKEKKTVETVVSLKDPKFIIASGALGSIVTYKHLRKDLIETCMNLKDKSALPAGFINYTKFFQLLNQYSNQKKPTIFNDKELKEILTAITPIVLIDPDPLGILALPSVKFPLTDNFIVVPLNDSLEIISNVKLKKHQIEKKPIIVTDKKAILIYPKDIPVLINMQTIKPVPVISMLPGIVTHTFDNLKVNSASLNTDPESVLLDTIVHLFDEYRSSIQKTFYFKKLTLDDGTQSESFYDVIVIVQSENIELFYTSKNQALNFVKGLEHTKLPNIKIKFFEDDFKNAVAQYFPDLLLNKKTALTNSVFINKLFEEFGANTLNSLLTSVIEKNQLAKTLLKDSRMTINDLTKNIDHVFPGFGSLLMLAASKGDVQLARILTVYGADPNKQITDEASRKINPELIGQSALSIAQNKVKINPNTKEFKEILDLLTKTL